MRILYLGPVGWNTMRQRPQHLAGRLMREFPLCYVGPVGLRGVRLGDLRRQFSRRAAAPCTVRPENEVIAEIRPRYVPFPGLPGVAAVNRRWLWRQLRNAFPFDDGPWTLWASTPSILAETLLDHGRPSLVVYDCMDRYAAFHGGRTSRRIDLAEARVVARADLVFGSSRGLCERLDRIEPGSVLLANGVDASFFAVDRPAKLPESLVGLPRPVIGFHGTLGEWVDYPLVAALARARPQWSFAFIGPRFSPRANALTGLPNVHFFGEAPYSQLPRLSACFDVGVLPFAMNELTRHVHPIKVLEYLALGLPSVCTPLPDLAPLATVVEFATGIDEWLAALDLAVRPEQRATPLVDARRVVARQHDWDRVAADAIARLRAAWNANAWRRPAAALAAASARPRFAEAA